MLSIEFTNKNESMGKVDYLLLTSSKELKKDTGFVENYYKILKYFKNQESAFMYLNVLHFKKYNAFKYKSYKEFKKNMFK